MKDSRSRIRVEPPVMVQREVREDDDLNGQNDQIDLDWGNQYYQQSKGSHVRLGPDPLITISARGF